VAEYALSKLSTELQTYFPRFVILEEDVNQLKKEIVSKPEASPPKVNPNDAYLKQQLNSLTTEIGSMKQL